MARTVMEGRAAGGLIAGEDCSEDNSFVSVGSGRQRA